MRSSKLAGKNSGFKRLANLDWGWNMKAGALTWMDGRLFPYAMMGLEVGMNIHRKAEFNTGPVFDLIQFTKHFFTSIKDGFMGGFDPNVGEKVDVISLSEMAKRMEQQQSLSNQEESSESD